MFCQSKGYPKLSYTQFKTNLLDILNKESKMGHEFIYQDKKLAVSNISLKLKISI